MYFSNLLYLTVIINSSRQSFATCCLPSLILCTQENAPGTEISMSHATLLIPVSPLDILLSYEKAALEAP